MNEEYRQWLTTLNENQINTERSNLEFMATGKISWYTKVIAEMKLEKLRSVNTKER